MSFTFPDFLRIVALQAVQRTAEARREKGRLQEEERRRREECSALEAEVIHPCTSCWSIIVDD